MRSENKKRFSLSPTQIILFGFPLLILLGALLLSLPFAAKEGVSVSFIDALFTSVSATCVTGLVTVDTFTTWTVFGQTVILFLIQIGGLGFMTIAIFFSLILRRAISPRERMVAAQSVSMLSQEGVIRHFRLILSGTFAFEGIGACLLAIRFIPRFGFGEGIRFSVFHAISAFCNAGFDLFGGESGAFSSLSSFASDRLVLLTLSFLIVVGGIGFVVWRDVADSLLHKKRLPLYSRLVLISSFCLTLFGFLFFLSAEWNNPAFAGEGIGNKCLSAFFQSVTLRTAGFSTFSPASLGGPSKLLSCLLMFIGGSSGGTAGGVKTVTVAVLLIAAVQNLEGRSSYSVQGRRIPRQNVDRAFALGAIALAISLSSSILLALSEKVSLSSSLFECFSAFGTVGISFGLTPSLTLFGKILLMTLMFFGRIGILTLTLTISRRQAQRHAVISFPEEKNLLIG